MVDTALVIMARYPQPGQTKTRLARSIGNEATLALYQAFLQDLAERFAHSPLFMLHWAYTPIENDFQTFITTIYPEGTQHMHCFAQEGENFGAKLLNAFKWTEQNGFQSTILISSDSPQISRKTIEQASNALERADVVLGPAEDGGYYLIAMRKPYDVFSGIPMSTEVVFQMTVESAQRQGLRVESLDSLFDVDEVSDLLKLEDLLENDLTLAPHTSYQLQQLKIRKHSNSGVDTESI